MFFFLCIIEQTQFNLNPKKQQTLNDKNWELKLIVELILMLFNGQWLMTAISEESNSKIYSELYQFFFPKTKNLLNLK
jgi:hypothetical protein